MSGFSLQICRDYLPSKCSFRVVFLSHFAQCAHAAIAFSSGLQIWIWYEIFPPFLRHYIVEMQSKIIMQTGWKGHLKSPSSDCCTTVTHWAEAAFSLPIKKGGWWEVQSLSMSASLELTNTFFHTRRIELDANTTELLGNCQQNSNIFNSLFGHKQWNSLCRIVVALHTRCIALRFQNKFIRGSSTGSYLTYISVSLKHSQIYQSKRNRLSAPLQLCF